MSGSAVARGRLAFATVSGDLRSTVEALPRTLGGIGFDPADLVRLDVTVGVAAGLEGTTVLEGIAGALTPDPGPAVSVIRTNRPEAPPVQIECVAARGARRVVSEPGEAFATAVQVDELIWTSGVTTPRPPGDLVRQSSLVLDSLEGALGELGATLDDTVKANIFYVGDGTAEDWAVAARVRSDRFSEPAGAATGIPVPGFEDERVLTSIALWAARGQDGSLREQAHSWPEGHWGWPIHLAWRHGCRCGELAFVGGEVSLAGSGEVVDPGNMERQTRTAMANVERVLAPFDRGLDDVVRLTAFYEAGAGDPSAHIAAALGGREATVGLVPLPFLAYRDMVVEIEAVAAWT